MSDFILVNGLHNQAAFGKQLAARFPAIAAQIDDHERGLLHLEMAVLARATCCAIEEGCSEDVRAHFVFIDDLFSNAAPDLENAIYVSYLENVFLGQEDHHYVFARTHLSKRMHKALVELEQHWKQNTQMSTE